MSLHKSCLCLLNSAKQDVQYTMSAEPMRQFVMISAGDTVPLTTFVNFAQGSDVVIHESVGPVWNFSTAGVAGQNILLVSNSNGSYHAYALQLPQCYNNFFLGLSVSKVIVQSLSECTKTFQDAQSYYKQQSEPYLSSWHVCNK